MKLPRYIHIISGMLGLTFGAVTVFGAATSTNFQLESEQIDSGGDIATSSNFTLEGTIGQFVSGTLESTSFTTVGGGGAGSAGGSTGENQVSPVVSTINFSYTDNGSALGFSEGITPAIGTTTIYVYGTVIDQNGSTTIASVIGNFYRTSLGASCALNNFDCYQPVGACTITPTTATAAHYACRYDLASHLDATDTVGTYPADSWTARVVVTDTSTYSNSAVDDIEMNSLSALTLATSTISFASMALGATTTASTSQGILLSQAGNTAADIMLSSFTNLTCTQSGYIPKENLTWSIFNVGYTSASSTSFSSTPVRAYLNVSRKVNATTPTGNAYFNLGIPTQGLSGSCAGSVILNIVPVQ